MSTVAIPAGAVTLEGELTIPPDPRGVVVFAHGSGSSRRSPRNRFVAETLNRASLGTLLMDLLTREEEQVDLRTTELRFDVGLLGERLVAAIDWLQRDGSGSGLPAGCFGASTGAAAALIAAAQRAETVAAVVSRGGRPDLAHEHLRLVTAPTLLIVGGRDHAVIDLNRDALAVLRCNKELRVVAGASHLFEEPGALESVADLAARWFRAHLVTQDSPITPAS